MQPAAASLHQVYRRRIDVPLLILFAIGLLALGLYLPILNVQQLLFMEQQYSVVTGIIDMARQGDLALAVIIFLFSVVFPGLKLTLLLVVWLWPQTHASRHRMLTWLGGLGKWSMLDVFIVAIIIVICRGGRWVNATPMTGLYVFASAIALSMVLTIYIHHLATKTDQRETLDDNEPREPNEPRA